MLCFCVYWLVGEAYGKSHANLSMDFHSFFTFLQKDYRFRIVIVTRRKSMTEINVKKISFQKQVKKLYKKILKQKKLNFKFKFIYYLLLLLLSKPRNH